MTYVYMSINPYRSITYNHGTTMNKQKVLNALEPIIACDTTRRKIATHGYLSLTTVARGSISPRKEIEDALNEAGYGTQGINKIITVGIY